jgi:hypothetical protein
MHYSSQLVAFSALLLTLATAAPSEDGIFGRAIGDSCKGTEGKGTCQPTGNCKGISYPQGFCPKDPDDIQASTLPCITGLQGRGMLTEFQCCVEIGCQVGSKTGFCRSVKNNGCPGGTFDPGNHCPGPQDIQCCLKGDQAPPTPPGSGGDVGARILEKAMTAANKPCSSFLPFSSSLQKPHR